MKREAETAPVERTVLVKGLPASPGRVSGIAHVILSPNLIDNFKEGEILVTEMTAPDWVPAMKKAKAIVTDSGGMTCHASIVSRELGIPCVVGTKSRGTSATTKIETGMQITVDATNGIIYDGVISDLIAPPRPAEAGPRSRLCPPGHRLGCLFSRRTGGMGRIPVLPCGTRPGRGGPRTPRSL